MLDPWVLDAGSDGGMCEMKYGLKALALLVRDTEN